MVIDVKAINNSIRIKCKPIIPAEFKYKLLEKVGNLYTLKVGDSVDFQFDKELGIKKKKKEFLNFYLQNEFDYTFEEFLELAMFPVGIVELLSKNNEEKIAFIDFVPDGDVDLVWIDVYDKEHQQKLLNTIREIL